MPIRRISEILGVNVDYDSNTKTVLLTSNNYKLGKDTENIMPNTNILTEEEIQTAINKNATFITEINNYQDFKSVWTVVDDFQMSDGTYTNVARFNQGVSKETFIALWSNIPYEDILKYSEKLVAEKQEISFKGQDLTLTFGWTDGILGTATCFSDGRTTSNFSNNTIN